MQRDDHQRGDDVRELAAFAGLYEGIAFARHDVIMDDPTPTRLLFGAGCIALVVAVHLVAWSAVGATLGRRAVEPARLVTSLWLLVAIAARGVFGDRAPGPVWLVPAALVTAWWTLGPRARGRVALLAGRPWTYLCVFAIATVGMLGRVPDPAVGAAALAAFAASSAIAAALMVRAVVVRPRITGAVVAAALAGVAALHWREPPPRGDRPNVLWIMVDTLRRDHVSAYADLVATPALERLAREGVRFDDAVTVSPKTSISVASFLTGRYPHRHGLRSLYDPLRADEESLAEVLRDEGYRTAAFVHNAWLRRSLGYDQGFRRYLGFDELAAPYGVLGHVAWVAALDRVTLRRIRPFDGQTSAATLTDAACDYLREVGTTTPFFAYVHYFEPHWPYRPPDDLSAEHGVPPGVPVAVNEQVDTDARGAMIFRDSISAAEADKARRLYRAEVASTAREIGRLLDALDQRGMADETIVVFSADHGHSLGAHGYSFHHGAFLYDDSIRIPLILRHPGRVPSGVAVTEQVRSIDVAPTIAELVGARLPRADGQSLTSTWTTGGDVARSAYLESDVKMFAANERRERAGIAGKLRAVRDGRFKLILAPRREGGFRLTLFDLVADPDELENLASRPDHAETVERLLRDLRAEIPDPEWQGILRSSERGDAPTLDYFELELLRSLGYI